MNMTNQINFMTMINELDWKKLDNFNEVKTVCIELKNILGEDVTDEERNMIKDTIFPKLLALMYDNNSQDIETLGNNIKYFYSELKLGDNSTINLNIDFIVITLKYSNNSEIIRNKIKKLLENIDNDNILPTQRDFIIYRNIALYAIRNNLSDVAKIAIDKMNIINVRSK